MMHLSHLEVQQLQNKHADCETNMHTLKQVMLHEHA